MPSGYTADIYAGKDVTLRDYLMQIGRGMGFAVMQRDSPPDEPIKRVEPSDYHDKRVAEASDRLKWLRGLTPAAAEQAAADDFKEKYDSWRESIAKAEGVRARYEAMLSEVRAWSPPEELAGAKEMAIQQLEQSIDFDCSMTYITEPLALSGPSWLTSELTRASRDLERAAVSRVEEIKRTAERNRYIDLFYAALPDEG